MYYDRLKEMAISMYEWINLPNSVDERFLELTLFSDGMCIFFEDSILGHLCLQTMIGGRLNVYRIPIQRTAYSASGYNKKLTEKNSVIIFNNMLHTSCVRDVELFAKRLYNLDRVIDVNANAQKTPVLIKSSEKKRLTMKNLYMQYDGNQPFIFGDDDLNTQNFQVLKTDAPYVCDKIYNLKTQYWNEALTYLGIPNMTINKKERVITDEVLRSQGGTIASGNSRLYMRKQACKQINEMFGLDIDVRLRDTFTDIGGGKDE